MTRALATAALALLLPVSAAAQRPMGGGVGIGVGGRADRMDRVDRDGNRGFRGDNTMEDPDRLDRQDRDGVVNRQDAREARRERKERIRRELELRLMLTISDELSLGEAETLRIKEHLDAGHARRRDVQKKLRASVKELRRLSTGAPTADEVNERLKTVSALRRQLLEEEERTLNDASAGLKPEQKARLAIILGMHERAVKERAMRKALKRQAQDTDGDGPAPEDGY